MTQSPTTRELYSRFIARSGLAAVQRWRHRHHVTIVTYHAIAASTFSEHLTLLSQMYKIVPLSDAVHALSGAGSLPLYPLVLTFDDGFQSFHSDVYPILQVQRAPATVFLTTGYVGSKDILWFEWVDIAFDTGADLAGLLPPAVQAVLPALQRSALMQYLKSAPDDERLALVDKIKARIGPLEEAQIAPHRLITWDEARAMQASGLITFGGHTRTHPILARSSLHKAQDEIAGCAADLRRELGQQLRHFAYPNGQPADFNEDIKTMVRTARFSSAVTAVRGTCRRGDDLYTLRRIGLDGSFSLNEVIAKLSGLWMHKGRGGM